MKLHEAIGHLQSAELEFAKRLHTIAERHASDADVLFTARRLAQECEERVESLGPFAERYRAEVIDDADTSSSGFVDQIRRWASSIIGDSAASGMTLLTDLRELFLFAQQVDIDWIILMQGARAVRDAELFELTESCHDRVVMAGKWVKTEIKHTAPQVLAAP